MQERAKANKLKEKMEKELIERDRQLQEVLAKQAAVSPITIIVSQLFYKCRFGLIQA